MKTEGILSVIYSIWQQDFSNSIILQFGNSKVNSTDVAIVYSFPIAMTATNYALSITTNVTVTTGNSGAMANYISKTSSSFTFKVANKNNYAGVPNMAEITIIGY